MDQWNTTEIPEIDPHTYSQSSTKEARIYNEKKTVGEVGQPHVNQ